MARSAPDGYTVLIAPDQLTSAPHVFKVNFDALKDFVPVIQLSRQPVVLAVHPKLGVGKLSELIALVKQKPGLSYATSGVGSQQHMAAEWFGQLAGIKLEHVPYRGGGQAINDLLAGHITLASLGSTPLIPHYKAGALKLLAQSTAERSPSIPDVPTYKESGVAMVLDHEPPASPSGIELRRVQHQAPALGIRRADAEQLDVVIPGLLEAAQRRRDVLLELVSNAVQLDSEL